MIYYRKQLFSKIIAKDTNINVTQLYNIIAEHRNKMVGVSSHMIHLILVSIVRGSIISLHSIGMKGSLHINASQLQS